MHAEGGNGFPHHYPKYDDPIFKDISFVFGFLLASLQAPRDHLNGLTYHSRIQPMTRGKIPTSAESTTEFHGHFAVKFLDECKPPWDTMDMRQKRRALRSWLFKKFTMDKAEQRMYPAQDMPTKKLNDINWLGFWLTDAEFEQVVDEIMTAYEADQT